MIDHLRVVWHQGKQFIPDVTKAEVPGIYRGRPVISTIKVDEKALEELCPTSAITTNPFHIDLGKCTFCGECAIRFPEKIHFTKDYKLFTNDRNRLLVYEGIDQPITLDPNKIRKEIRKNFGQSLKLRHISAGSDNSCEMELTASNNVQFDMSRFGIDFVASPRHADGILITGPISENMAEPLEKAYLAIPEPKIIVLAGTDAISGGIFADSPAIARNFISRYPVDLYIAGNPFHPLTLINALLELTRGKYTRA